MKYARLRVGLALNAMYIQHSGQGAANSLFPLGEQMRVAYCPDARRLVLRRGASENSRTVGVCDPEKNAGNTHLVRFVMNHPRTQEIVAELPNFCVDDLHFRVHEDLVNAYATLPETHKLPWGKKPTDPHDAQAVFAKGLRLRLRSAVQHGAKPETVLRRRPPWSNNLLDRDHFKMILEEEVLAHAA